MTAPRIAFRADATAGLGGGHVMRCLTVAQELRSRGAEVRFFLNEEAPLFAPKLDTIAWRAVPADPEATAAAIAEAGGADILVIDHYSIGAFEERRLRRCARHLVVIDDLADRRHDCDILVDQTLGRAASDYEALVT